MVEINLMSWRTQKILYERRKMKLLIVAGAAIAMIFVMIIHVLLGWQILRDEKILRQLAAVMPVITDAARDSQTLILDGVAEGFLTGKNAAMLLNVIAQSTANGVCYQQFSRDENGWRLTGQALSVAAFTSAWHSLAADIFFKNSVVNELKKAAGRDVFQFVLHVPAVQSGHGE